MCGAIHSPRTGCLFHRGCGASQGDGARARSPARRRLCGCGSCCARLPKEARRAISAALTPGRLVHIRPFQRSASSPGSRSQVCLSLHLSSSHRAAPSVRIGRPTIPLRPRPSGDPFPVGAGSRSGPHYRSPGTSAGRSGDAWTRSMPRWLAPIFLVLQQSPDWLF